MTRSYLIESIDRNNEVVNLEHIGDFAGEVLVLTGSEAMALIGAGVEGQRIDLTSVVSDMATPQGPQGQPGQ